MNICMISPEFTPNIYGGLGRHVTDISMALANRGANVHIITYGISQSAPEYEHHGNLHIHRVQFPITLDGMNWDIKSANMNCAFIWKANDVFRRFKIDILHAHDWSVSQSAFVLKQFYRIPLITTIHLNVEHGSSDSIEYHKSQLLSLIKSSNGIICCSNYMSNLLAEQYECKRSRVIPNGIFLNRFPFLEKLGRNILFLGRLIPRKGVDQLIQAFQLIHQFIDGNLIIIGESSPTYQSYLSDLANRLNISSRIQFVGRVPDELLNNYFSKARIFAIPSLYEPFGIVALEGMSSGIPIVVYDSGGLAEIVSDKVNGFKAKTNDVADLARCLRNVYDSTDDSLEIRVNARRDVEARYTWERVATSTSEVYDEVMTDFKR